MGLVHSGSPSLHTILEESLSVDNLTSSDGGSSGFPIPQDCNVVTSVIPIVTTPLSKATLMLQTIPTVPQRAAVPQPYTKFLPERL
jgi:hypothetical protein